LLDQLEHCPKRRPGCRERLPCHHRDRPANATRASTVANGRGSHQDGQMRGITLLIVDDHPGFRSMARDALDGRGFEVIGEEADGHGAIRAVERLRPMAVLLDVRLPDIDGFEVASRLRSGTVAPDVVLVSTREAADYGRRVSASGAIGFITKSRLSGDTLLATLRGERNEP
jgi:CheY-like chemotaxis protein